MARLPFQKCKKIAIVDRKSNFTPVPREEKNYLKQPLPGQKQTQRVCREKIVTKKRARREKIKKAIILSCKLANKNLQDRKKANTFH